MFVFSVFFLALIFRLIVWQLARQFLFRFFVAQICWWCLADDLFYFVSFGKINFFLFAGPFRFVVIEWFNCARAKKNRQEERPAGENKSDAVLLNYSLLFHFMYDLWSVHSGSFCWIDENWKQFSWVWAVMPFRHEFLSVTLLLFLYESQTSTIQINAAYVQVPANAMFLMRTVETHTYP